MVACGDRGTGEGKVDYGRVPGAGSTGERPDTDSKPGAAADNVNMVVWRLGTQEGKVGNWVKVPTMIGTWNPETQEEEGGSGNRGQQSTRRGVIQD